MRTARVTGLFVALLLGVVTAVAGGSFAAAAVAEPTVISISGQPKLAIYHDEIGGKTADVVRHRGRLTTAGGDPVSGATVVLERKLSGEEVFTPLGDKTTDAEGRYTFYSYVAGNAKYQVRFTGDAMNEPSVSTAVPLKAMRDFNTGPVVEKPKFAVLKGNINPGWDNKVVHWQKRTCETCKWKTIGKDRAGKNGSWSFSGAYAPRGSKWYFRAVIDRTDDFVKSYSATLVTTTKPARSPAARVTAR